MRYLIILSLAALALSACATTSSGPSSKIDSLALAATDGATPGMMAAAQAVQSETIDRTQLRNIRNAEARLDLARVRLDYATVRRRGADDGDVREFLSARQELRRLRNVYGPTDTGYRDRFSVPFYPYGGHWPRRDRGWLSGPSGIGGEPRLDPNAALPLSSMTR